MFIIDQINNSMITVEDYIDAYREAKSRVNFYNKNNKPCEMYKDGDRIYIRRKD